MTKTIDHDAPKLDGALYVDRNNMEDWVNKEVIQLSGIKKSQRFETLIKQADNERELCLAAIYVGTTLGASNMAGVMSNMGVPEELIVAAMTLCGLSGTLRDREDDHDEE